MKRKKVMAQSDAVVTQQSMTNKQRNWYVEHIRRPVEAHQAADEIEAAVDVIMEEIFGCEPTEAVTASEALEVV